MFTEANATNPMPLPKIVFETHGLELKKYTFSKITVKMNCLLFRNYF